MKKFALIALVAGVPLMASAQEGPVGVLKDVKGAVTVSSPQTTQRAASGTAVVEGASVLLASDGAAKLALSNGCVLTLKANQHLIVNSKLACADMQASVQQLFSPYRVAQAPIGGGIIAPPADTSAAGTMRGALPVVMSGVVGVLAIVNGNSDSKPASGQ